MVSLQRLPMLVTWHGMEVDDARFFSRRAVRTFNVCCLRLSPVFACLVCPWLSRELESWSHVRVRRTIFSCDLGGRLTTRTCTADQDVCKLESTFFATSVALDQLFPNAYAVARAEICPSLFGLPGYLWVFQLFFNNREVHTVLGGYFK